MTEQHNRRAAITTAVGAVMIVLGFLAAIARGDLDRVTVVRTSRAASADQYLTGNDIEAIQVDHSDVAGRDYVTVDQAQLGLSAAHDLDPGEFLDASDVYTSNGDVNLVPPESSASLPIAEAMGLLLIAAGAAIGWLGTRGRHSGRSPNHGDTGMVVREPATSGIDLRVTSNSAALIVEHPSTVTAGLDPTTFIGCNHMLDNVRVNRRDDPPASSASAPDADAQPVALHVTSTGVLDDALPVGDDVMKHLAGGNASIDSPLASSGPVEVPHLMLTVCGREVAVRGRPVQQGTAVLFLLAAAGREMRSSELTELTGYSPKTLSTVFTASHELVKRNSGTLRLANHVWTDHAWATRCVTQLAGAMRLDAESGDTTRWMLTAFEALQALEHGPFEVLPATRERARSGMSPWGWIDDYPADLPARSAAETEVAEAALALSELWLSAPGTHRVVSAEQMIAELCRLAAKVPYAHVVRQLRPSTWASGADCLLSAAARVADDEEALLNRVQQTARTLAARGHLDASNELADELRL